MKDDLELERPDVGVRFRWQSSEAFVDISPLSLDSPGVYEGVDVRAEHELSAAGLAAFADTGIAANRDLLRP